MMGSFQFALTALFLLGPVFFSPKTVGNPGFSLTTNEQNRDLVEKIYRECNKKLDSDDLPTDKCIEEFLKNHQDEVEKFKKKSHQGQEVMPVVKKNPSVSRELLRKYLDRRFQEKVRGKKKGEEDARENLIDHAYFFEFYQSQLTKVAIMNLSSYCKPKDKNIDQYLEDENMFQKCIASLGSICHGTNASGDKSSKEKACRASGKLRKINRALRANEERIHYFRCKKKFKKGKHCGRKGGFQGIWADSKEIELYNPKAKGKSIDDITSLTAREFEENVIQKIEQACPEGTNPPSEECLEMLKLKLADSASGPDEEENRKDREEENKKALTEFKLQGIIIKQNIEEYGKEDIAREVASVGGSEDVIKAIQEANDEQIKKLKEDMIKRYAEEREAARKKLIERLNKEKEEKLQNASSVAKIKERNKGIKQLLFFNNIVSSYLSIIDPITGKSIGRNLASFRREIDISRNENIPLDKENKELIENLSKRLEKLEKEDQKNHAQNDGPTNPNLSAEQIHKAILQESPNFYREIQKNKQ